MAIGYLNERTRNVILMILKGSSVMSIKEIASELSVSTRTVYNELDKANRWLEMNKLPLIQVIRGRIQLFSGEDNNSINEELELEDEKYDYIFTPTERTHMIICLIIISRKPVYVEELMDACMVSRNTIFNDLAAVHTMLRTYQLKLEYESKKGYWIDGDPIRVRAIFFLYFSMLEPLFSSGRLGFISMQEMEPYLGQIEMFEKELKVSYVRKDMISLAAMIPVMLGGEDTLFFSDVNVRKVKDTREYRLVNKYFPELPEEERIYLTLHFLGGRLASFSESYISEDINESVKEIAINLVQEFERRACVIFKQKDELIHNLYQHIRSSIYRYRFGIQIGNLMAEDIMREYPYLFDVARACVQYLEQQIGVQISDSEVAYLVLHFGAHLEFAKNDEKQLRILVVCMNGVATGNMISHELSRILPQAKITGVIAASELSNPQGSCDIIVSSVKLHTVVPVIVVNPVLNDFDRRNILKHPIVRSRYGYVDVEALFQTIKKYVPKENYRLLRHELEIFFTGGGEERQQVLNPEYWRLTDFLTGDRIVFLDDRGRKKDSGHADAVPSDGLTNAERSLYTVAAPLIERGSITEGYVESIVGRLAEAGAYMFVTRDLILAHARPEDGVKHLDLSIGFAPDGITFDGGKTARIVFLLAAEDQQKHMGILKDIRKTLARPAQVDALVKITDQEGIIELIRSGLID